MTVYTTVPQDDSNLEITIIESDDLVTLDLNSASFNLIGAVNSVNGLQGDVVIELGLPESEIQTLIDTSIATIDYPVDSVNGATGDVVLTTGDIAEADNLYYTDSRVDTFLTDGSVSSINFGNNTALTWNPVDFTLDMPLDGVTVQLGQETLARVVNRTGATITNGSIVRTTGSQGQRMTVAVASNSNDNLSATVLGVATQDILNNQEGFITITGLVRGINTLAFTEGTPLYLGSNGAMTDTRPDTPLHMVLVGYCIRSHAVLGSVFVKAQNGYELSEMHDVLVTNPVDGQGIVWDALNGYWINGEVSADLTGYATETYVDAAIFSGDYNDLSNSPTIPALVSELTNDAGYITGPGNVFETANQFRFITEYGIPSWDPYDGEFRIANYTDPGNSLINTVTLLTGNNNIFLNVEVADTGTGDDGSHATALKLLGSSTGISATGDFTLQTDSMTLNSDGNVSINSQAFDVSTSDILLTANNIFGATADQIQIAATSGASVSADSIQLSATGPSIDISAAEHNFINSGVGTTYINARNGVGDYNELEISSLRTQFISQTDSAEELNIPFRIIRKHSDPVDYADDTQILVQFGAGDGVNFYQLGQLGGRFDRTDGHETKLQTMNPADNSLLNNWTVHEHYSYGGKPIRQSYYNDLDRDALAVVQDGMLIWNTDELALQVYSSGAWAPVGGGGGGASALDDLSDVSVNAGLLGDGDILRYNGTAAEWQNTNLAISVTPAVSLSSTFFKGTGASCIITNYGVYDDPNIWAQVKDSSGTVVVVNAQITDNYNGTFDFPVPNTLGTYTLEVRVQDFGDLSSEIAAQSFDVIEITGTFRYWRFTSDPNSTGGVQFQGVNEVRLYTGSGQTGTKWPTASMTANNVPAPFVASSRYNNAGANYNPHEAFDTNTGSGWIDSFTNLPGMYLQIDLGSSVNIKSFSFRAGILTSFTPAAFSIYGSDTGDFAGEETLVATMTGMPNTGEGYLG